MVSQYKWATAADSVHAPVYTCSCHEHTTNLATGVSWQPALDCGTTFHPDCGAGTFFRFLQAIFENTSLWRLMRLVTLSTYRRYINKCVYLSICL